MKNKILVALAVVLIPAGYFINRTIVSRGAASDFRDAPISGAFDQLGGSSSPEVTPVPEAAPALGHETAPAAFKQAPARQKEWTVMVFINAKNNLDPAGIMNVNDMERIGSTDKVNIVAEFGRMKGQQGAPAAAGDWDGVRRYYITKNDDPDRILSPALQYLGPVDMGDPQTAVDFVKWSKRHFPAKKYLFIMWNHGGGWMSGVSSDDETGHVINAKKIGEVARQIGGVDVLAFDACLMQMAEVAYEVKDYAKVVVGSEETIPGMGYPYSIFLSALAENPAMGPEALGAAIVDAYGAYYSAFKNYKLNATGKGDVGVTLSAIRTSKLPELAARIREFATLARASRDKNAMKIAKTGTTRYGVFGGYDQLYTKTPYADLYSFVKLFSWQLDRKARNAAALKQSADGLKDFISKSLVIKNVAIGDDPLGHPITESYGISVYMPPTSPSMTKDKIDRMANIPYADLDFNKRTDWLDFVIFMYKIELMEGRELPAQSDNVEFS